MEGRFQTTTNGMTVKKKDMAFLLLNCNMYIHSPILGALCTCVINSWVLQLSCRTHTFLLYCHVRCRVTGLWHWHMTCCLDSCWVWQSWVMSGCAQPVILWCAQQSCYFFWGQWCVTAMSQHCIFVPSGCIHICKYLESTILKITTCSSSCSACPGTEVENFFIRENMLWRSISSWWGFPLAQHVVGCWYAWLIGLCVRVHGFQCM